MLTPLISSAQLLALQSENRWPVVIDASFDLTDASAGERSYLDGRLTGAFYAHLEHDLSAPLAGTGEPFRGRHPLPERSTFAQTVARWGVRPGVQVVVCDRQGGMIAARAWWMLRWLGHDAVAVLDGGVPAWTRAGGWLDGGRTPPPQPAAAAPYPECEPRVGRIDADALARQLGRAPLIDARAPERFRGEVEPLDAVAGHIPGARNRFFKDNLAADGCFKPADELRQAFLSLLGPATPDTLVHQCGSGVTACHNLLAMEVAGLTGSKLYPGSWSEWSAQPGRPVARG